jgi:hypothetical protein
LAERGAFTFFFFFVTGCVFHASVGEAIVMEQDELAELEERVVKLKGAKKELQEEWAKTGVSRALEQLWNTDALLEVARERLDVANDRLQVAKDRLQAAKDRRFDDLERRLADLTTGKEDVVDGVKVDVLTSFSLGLARIDIMVAPGNSTSSVVGGFRKRMLRPVLLKADEGAVRRAFGGTLQDGCGWVMQGAEELAFAVEPETLCTRISAARVLVMALQERVFERSTAGLDRGVFLEHTLDCTIHAELLLRPWTDCMCANKQLAYGSDSNVQGAVNKIMLFGTEANKTVRLDVKPDSFLFWIVGNQAVLLVHSEHKADNSSDLEKGKRTALAQCCLLRGILKEEALVPFMTIERKVVSLYVMWPQNGAFLWAKVESWDVTMLTQAHALMAAMYRLAEWACETGKKLEQAMPKVLREMKMSDLTKQSLPEPSVEQPSTDGSKGTRKSIRQGERKANEKEHTEAVDFLCAKFGKHDVEEQFPGGMPVAEWHENGFVRRVEKGPWHFAVREQKVWVKVFASNEKERGEQEVANLRLFESERLKGVPRLVDSWELESGGVVVATEYCGPSVQRVESWEELARRALELGEALAAVHGLGRVHGDVKETNMCAAEGGVLKLTDWESGVRAGERPRMHTEGYRAPETVLEEGRWFCAKSDVYSAGIVLSKWVKRLHKQHRDEAAREKWLKIAARMTAEKVEERMDAAELVRELVGATEETKGSPAKDSPVGSE